IQRIKRPNQQNDRNMRKGSSVFHKLANFIAVGNWHENCRQNEVGFHIGNLADGCLAVAHGHNFNSLILQGENYHLLDIAVVVRNQDLGHRTSSDAPTQTRRDRTSAHCPLDYWSIGDGTRQRKPPKGVSEGNTPPVTVGASFLTVRSSRELPGNDLLQSFFLFAGRLFLWIRCAVGRLSIGIGRRAVPRRCTGITAVAGIWRGTIRTRRRILRGRRSRSSCVVGVARRRRRTASRVSALNRRPTRSAAPRCRDFYDGRIACRTACTACADLRFAAAGQNVGYAGRVCLGFHLWGPRSRGDHSLPPRAGSPVIHASAFGSGCGTGTLNATSFAFASPTLAESGYSFTMRE